MKNLFYFIAVSLSLIFNACSDSANEIDPFADKISKEVRSDINKRFSQFTITSCYDALDGLQKIELQDENDNAVQLHYKNNEFEAEYKKIAELTDLPQKVQEAFSKSSVVGMHDLEIFKTERAYLKHDLYTFRFLQTAEKVKNLICRELISDDGTHLLSVNTTANDDILLLPNYLESLQFVKEHYPDADVRAQYGGPTRLELIILHEGYTKFVRFLSDDPNAYSFWEETKYEVPLDYPVPTSLLNKLKEIDSTFVYTNIIKIETPAGNEYSLTDHTRYDKFGYIIPE